MSKKKLKKSQKNPFFFFKKSEIFLTYFFSAKKSSLFLSIMNTQFNQSSPVEPNPRKKSQKITFFKKSENFNKKIAENNSVLLVLPIEEISLRPELSSPAHFRIQGG